MTDSTPRSTRKSTKRITLEETQMALDFIVESMGDDRISPMAAINGSANGLIEQYLEVTNSRAAYILDLLVKAGAVSRVENSRKVIVNRATVRLDNPPALSDSDKERYEATIRRLNTLLEEERANSVSMAAELEELKAQLDELTKTDGPSSDVMKIMAEVGVV